MLAFKAQASVAATPWCSHHFDGQKVDLYEIITQMDLAERPISLLAPDSSCPCHLTQG